MENIVHWQGAAVGIDCGTHIAWFASASHEAIEELSKRFMGYMTPATKPLIEK